MKLKQLACFIISSTIVTSVIAYPIDRAPNKLSTLTQQILKNYPKQNVTFDNIMQSRLISQRELKYKILLNLREKLVKSNIQVISKHEIINQIDTIKNQSASSINASKLDEINFLDLQLNDALTMLQNMQQSADQTYNVLNIMNQLADVAANGNHSKDEMELLNTRFLMYKGIINYIQSTDTLDGEKKLSGGDFSIQIGESYQATTLLKITIPSFDTDTLALTDLSIDTIENAYHAIDVLKNAFGILDRVIASTNSDAITDTGTFIRLIPFILNQDMQLFNLMQELIEQAANGALNDDDRALMNIEFDNLKSALQKTQTYDSLDGPKLLGGGTLHIQIGKYVTPETTLTINLPITDVNATGLDKLDIKTLIGANTSLDALLKLKHNFAYQR